MNILDQFKKIRAFVFDMDGVLTDGTVYVFDSGEQVRRMSIRDGFALQLAVKKGYRVAVISGGHSSGAASRLNKLGITDVFMDVKDKRSVLLQYMSDHGFSRDEVLFMGDDIPDHAAMKESDLSCAPADAAPEIKKIAGYIAIASGGMGCAREVIEKTLKLNGCWELETDTASR
ncbi:MAG TPA: HAD hydrolase family protein [Flavitalea sp.]|nr:HAD hydrolase family protein [Flavitalea sp.]